MTAALQTHSSTSQRVMEQPRRTDVSMWGVIAEGASHSKIVQLGCVGQHTAKSAMRNSVFLGPHGGQKSHAEMMGFAVQCWWFGTSLSGHLDCRSLRCSSCVRASLPKDKARLTLFSCCAVGSPCHVPGIARRSPGWAGHGSRATVSRLRRDRVFDCQKPLLL